MIVYSTDGRVIGTIEAGVFHKNVNKDIHMLTSPPGWATDSVSFDKYVVPNCHTIMLTEEVEGVTYTTSVELFRAHRFVINRRFGLQYVLPLKWWSKKDSRQSMMI